MKGIILAGGSGTRLYPCTKVISKQLMPVYDKPMMYYPLSVLMMAGLREILIISTPHDLPLFQAQLGDGSNLGVSFQYAQQPQPEGLPQAFVIAKEFLAGDSACLILGDNILYGHGVTDIVRRAAQLKTGGLVFAYQVKEPARYGVIEFDKNDHVLSIEEKPQTPKSHYAIPGLYFFDSTVCEKAASLRLSHRGEYEITDLMKIYMASGQLQVEKMGRGIAWLDTGTHHSLLEAGTFVQTIQERQGLMIACLEEIAYANAWIGKKEVEAAMQQMGKSSYASYLSNLLKDESH